MNHDRALYWVQHNRTRRDRAQNAAASVVRLVERVLGPFSQSRMATVSNTCAGIVDDEFRASCRLAMPDEHTLTVLVDAPAMIPVLRRRWEQIILRELSAARGGIRVTRVNFEFGTTGIRIPPAAQTAQP